MTNTTTTTQASIQRGMAAFNATSRGSTTRMTTSMPGEAVRPTLSEREQLRIEFYKTYDVMTGVRIAATLGGFFSLMVLLVIYKSRCKSNRQLEDPTLKAAAAAAVEEAEAEERALAAALEEIARQRPRPVRGPRRSLCVDIVQPRLPVVTPRFASVGGDYDSLLAAAPMRPRLTSKRRCSSITCSSTASSYLERRGSAMVMPCLPPPPNFPRHATAFDEPWDYYHPIDIQVIQPTPELSPCGSEAGLYGATSGAAAAAALQRRRQQQQQDEEYQYHQIYQTLASGRRAPLASMGSMDPPEPDSRSLGSDSVFLEEAARRAAALATVEDYPPDTEDEVSGFSTDSSDGGNGHGSSLSAGTGVKRYLKVPPKKKRPPERWDGCAGCVPRRRLTATRPLTSVTQPSCMTISASVEAPRSPMLSTTTSSSASNLGSPPPQPLQFGSTIELKHRPKSAGATATTSTTVASLVPPRTSSSPPPPEPLWSQETLF